MRSVGIEAEAGGTQVGLAFQQINDALRSGGEQMQLLERLTGQTGAALREEFFGGRSAAVFRRFVEGLGEARDRGEDVATLLNQMGLNGVRAVQVLGTLSTRAEVLGHAMDMANKS